MIYRFNLITEAFKDIPQIMWNENHVDQRMIALKRRPEESRNFTLIKNYAREIEVLHRVILRGRYYKSKSAKQD